mmetsp:Transcript_306/g.1135  ORF Transcript_306/g.1135 Transcript_306/m.1135 type:complete len:299 (+) Transcript_306:38-934(+)
MNGVFVFLSSLGGHLGAEGSGELGLEREAREGGGRHGEHDPPRPEPRSVPRRDGRPVLCRVGALHHLGPQPDLDAPLRQGRREPARQRPVALNDALRLGLLQKDLHSALLRDDGQEEKHGDLGGVGAEHALRGGGHQPPCRRVVRSSLLLEPRHHGRGVQPLGALGVPRPPDRDRPRHAIDAARQQRILDQVQNGQPPERREQGLGGGGLPPERAADPPEEPARAFHSDAHSRGLLFDDVESVLSQQPVHVLLPWAHPAGPDVDGLVRVRQQRGERPAAGSVQGLHDDRVRRGHERGG